MRGPRSKVGVTAVREVTGDASFPTDVNSWARVRRVTSSVQVLKLKNGFKLQVREIIVKGMTASGYDATGRERASISGEAGTTTGKSHL